MKKIYLTNMKQELLNFKDCTCENPPCYNNIDLNILVKLMVDARDKNLDGKSKRNYISGIMSATILSENAEENGNLMNKKNAQRSRIKYVRQSTMYSLYRWTICKSTFQFIFDISHNLLDAILKDFKQKGNGLFKPSYSTRNKNGIKNVIFCNFLRNYKCLYAQPSSGAKYGSKIGCWSFIPAGTTKKKVYGDFINTLNTCNIDTNTTYAYFVELWKTKMYYELRINKLGSDFCDYCTYYKSSTNKTEEMTWLYELHIKFVKQERQFY